MNEHPRGDADRSGAGDDPRGAHSPNAPSTERDERSRLDNALASEIEAITDEIHGLGGDDDVLNRLAGEGREPDAELAHITRTLDDLLEAAAPDELTGVQREIDELRDAAAEIESLAQGAAGHAPQPDEPAALESILDGVFEDAAVVLGTVETTRIESTAAQILPPGASPNQSPPVPAASPAPAPASPQGEQSGADAENASQLASIDASMAAELDAVLEGGFETVDEVLNVVFEAQATVVGEVSQPTDAISELQAAPAAMTAPPQQDEPSPAIVESPAPAIAAAPAPGKTPAPSPPPPPPGAQDAIVAAAMDAARSDAAPPSAKRRSAPTRGERSEADEPDGSQEESHASVQAIVVRRPVREYLTRLEPVARLVLSQLNYPLRLLPRRARTVVDFIALTLIFWVPIVWIVALFIM